MGQQIDIRGAVYPVDQSCGDGSFRAHGGLCGAGRSLGRLLELDGAGGVGGGEPRAEGREPRAVEYNRGGRKGQWKEGVMASVAVMAVVV